MKKNILYIFVAAILFITSCDVIEPPYTKKNETTPVDTTKRNVMIEDFTGFRCGNCPEAAHLAEEFAKLYEGRVFVVSLHAGPLSLPTPARKYDFRTSETRELADFYGLIATPYGMVSRMKFNNQTLLAPSAWAGYATEALQLEAVAKINLEAAYNTSNRQISGNIKIDYLKDSEVNQFCAVYLLEDSVIQYQQDDRRYPNIHVLDYEHNHVMRTSLSGTWGMQISESVIKAGNSVNIPINYTIPNDKDWRPEKLSLIAFIHNNDTKEVLQVEKIYLNK